MSVSARRIGKRSACFTPRRWRREGAMTGRRACGRIIMPTTTAPSCSIPTAIASKRCVMRRRRPRSSADARLLVCQYGDLAGHADAFVGRAEKAVFAGHDQYLAKAFARLQLLRGERLGARGQHRAAQLWIGSDRVPEARLVAPLH